MKYLGVGYEKTVIDECIKYTNPLIMGTIPDYILSKY